MGLILNAFFADSAIIALDGVSTNVQGGFLNRNWALLYKQICYVLAACAYTFVVTALIAKGVDMIPGLSLRAGSANEALGMDEIEVRETESPHPSLTHDSNQFYLFIYF